MKFEFIKMPGDANYTINSIKLTSANKALSGSASIAMTNNGVPTVALENKTENNNSFTLTCTNAIVSSTNNNDPAVFYLVVTPGTYSANELTLTFNVTYDGETKDIEKKISEEKVLARNTIVNIPYTLGSEDFTGNITGFSSTGQQANQ